MNEDELEVGNDQAYASNFITIDREPAPEFEQDGNNQPLICMRHGVLRLSIVTGSILLSVAQVCLPAGAKAVLDRK